MRLAKATGYRFMGVIYFTGSEWKCDQSTGASAGPRPTGATPGRPHDWEWRHVTRPAQESKTGVGYRLPSEAEWEHAARQALTPNKAFGNDNRQLCQHSNGADTTLPAASTQSDPAIRGNPECPDNYMSIRPR